MISKKRVYSQITQSDNIASRMALIKTSSKMRKLPGPLNLAQKPQLVDDSAMVEHIPCRKVSLSDLPWDCVGIVFDFTHPSQLKSFRLNRTFTRLVNKRRKGLSFKDKQILPETFGMILKNN